MMAERQAALLWLLGVLVGVREAQGSVGVRVSPDCGVFLYQAHPPAGLEHPTLRYICQRLRGQPRYLTLYDPLDRIPVYSAYTFKPSDGLKRADVPWMFEPQLSGVSDLGEMQPFPQEEVHRRFEDGQAVLEDYSNTVGFERGQLNPDLHQADPDDKAATYTLTNVVPQVWEFSSGPWGQQENRVRQRLNNYCRGSAYIVTGVTTSGLAIRRRGSARVAVPTYLWSAYCCPRYDHNAPLAERSKLPVFASLGLNQRDSQVSELTITDLQDFLKRVTFVSRHFQIFQEDCLTPPSSLR